MSPELSMDLLTGVCLPEGMRKRSKSVRVTYDPDANAVYMHLTSEELEPGWVSIPCESPDNLGAWVVLDWKDGRLVGLEVLDARERLSADLLQSAEGHGAA